QQGERMVEELLQGIVLAGGRVTAGVAEKIAPDDGGLAEVMQLGPHRAPVAAQARDDRVENDSGGEQQSAPDMDLERCQPERAIRRAPEEEREAGERHGSQQ